MEVVDANARGASNVDGGIVKAWHEEGTVDGSYYSW